MFLRPTSYVNNQIPMGLRTSSSHVNSFRDTPCNTNQRDRKSVVNAQKHFFTTVAVVLEAIITDKGTALTPWQ